MMLRKLYQSLSKGLLGGLTAALLLFAISAGPLSADTVELRNGRKFKNVKTRIKGRTIRITTRKGRVFRFPAKSVRLLIPAKVIWKKAPKKQPPKKVEPVKIIKPVVKKEPSPKKVVIKPVLPAPVTTPFFNRPLIRSVQGLVPLWSGHYAAKRYWLGALFSITEGLLLFQTLQAIQQPTAVQDNLATLTLWANLLPRPAPGGGPPPQLILGAPLGSWTQAYGLLAATGKVENVAGNGDISRQQHDKRATGAILSLGLLLLLDGVTSYFDRNPFGTQAPNNNTSNPRPVVLPALLPALHGRESIRPGVVFQMRF